MLTVMTEAAQTGQPAAWWRQGWPFRIWQLALLLFIVAAATGALLRFGLLYGLPGGLLFTDVRHAHSHLMFFGWATPLLMMLLLRQQHGTRQRSPLLLLSVVLLLAAASFVPFLLSGYRLLPLFGRELPVSMIVSGLNGLAWYVFAAVYLLADRKQPASTSRSFSRMSVWLLLLSSVGIVALAFAGMRGAGSTLINSLAYFFLELFAEGWFGVALLGIAFRLLLGTQRHESARVGLWLLAGGLSVRTAADVFVANGVDQLQPAVLGASAVAGFGLLVCLRPLWRVLAAQRLNGWHLALGLLTLKGVFDLLLAHPLLHQWSDAAGLRVFYLHAYLLGAISIGLVTAARSEWGARAFRLPWLFSAAVLLMAGALLPVSGLWPAAWSGRWTMVLAAWTSVGPVMLALLALLLSFRPARGELQPQRQAGTASHETGS